MKELKELPIIYKQHPDMLIQATESASTELESFKTEYELITQQIKTLQEDKQISQEQEWVPLYA